jgi:heparin binding hemagglutinin HbhA
MTITKSKPFYAVAGAGDFAVKKLREVPSRLSTLRMDRKDIESTIATIQVESKALPGKAQTVAVGLAGEVAGKADAVYGDLVTRGRSVVTRIRRQKATEELEAKAGTTVRRTRATTRTAKKAAAETRSSARGTATTARKRAAATTKAAKSAANAASDTAAAATKAVGDGAEKLGN